MCTDNCFHCQYFTVKLWQSSLISDSAVIDTFNIRLFFSFKNNNKIEFFCMIINIGKQHKKADVAIFNGVFI